MTTPLLVRAAALAAAFGLRHRGPRAALPLVGFAAGVALLGLGPERTPDSAAAAVLTGSLAVVFAVLFWPVWPPVVSEAAQGAVFFGAPVAAWGAFVLRGRPFAEVSAGALALAAVVAIAAALGSQASGEAGWRRPALWALAVAVAAGVGGGFAAALRDATTRERAALAAGAALLCVAAFAPAYFLEGRRVLRELGDEAKLGVLPQEDVETLARPWRRAREPRFGRADERREYVRSALLLAVALQQQRRRSGEAVRLRQLEVLAFRTRVRRTLEARAARAAVVDELVLPA